MNCIKCNGDLKPFNPKEDCKEQYLKCCKCGMIHAKVKIPNYKVTG